MRFYPNINVEVTLFAALHRLTPAAQTNCRAIIDTSGDSELNVLRLTFGATPVANAAGLLRHFTPPMTRIAGGGLLYPAKNCVYYTIDLASPTTGCAIFDAVARLGAVTFTVAASIFKR